MAEKGRENILDGIVRLTEVNIQLKAKKGPYYQRWKRGIIRGAKRRGSRNRE